MGQSPSWPVDAHERGIPVRQRIDFHPVRKHGLIEKAGIEPEDEGLGDRGFLEFPVLAAQRLEDLGSAQSATGFAFQEPGAGVQRVFIRPARMPGTVVENVMPDEDLPGQVALRQRASDAIAACDVQGPFTLSDMISAAAARLVAASLSPSAFVMVARFSRSAEA